MRTMPPHLPKHLWVLLVLYGLASLIHFVHNAEYLAFYPRMPGWITREMVYAVWLAEAAVGVLGIGLAAMGWRMVSALALSAYGALGLDGLAHYAFAPCSQHSLTMNATIGFEVVAGVALAGAALCFVVQRMLLHLRLGRSRAG